MAQGQIGQAAGGDVGGIDRAIAALAVHVAVEGHQVDAPVSGGGKAHEGGAVGLGGGEGRPVDGASQLGQGHRLHRHGGKDVYVVGPGGIGVHRPGTVAVVVARGDEHRDLDLAQGAGEGLHRLLIGLAGVQQIAGQEHQIGPHLLGQVGQPVQQLPLLLPPLPCLVRGQGGKGGIQMKVRPVNDGQHGDIFLSNRIPKGSAVNPAGPAAQSPRTCGRRYRWRRGRSPACRAPPPAQTAGAGPPGSG